MALERPQPPRAVGQAVETGGADNAWQKQHIGPGEEPGDHPGNGAARRRSAPEQPAEKSGRQLGDGGER
jgi:hypothetical protein